MWKCNLAQNICILFHVLTNFLLPQLKRNYIIITRKCMYELTDELSNNLSLGFHEIKKFWENPWSDWNWWRVTNHTPKRKTLTVTLENWEKPALKHAIENTILISFVNLSTTLFFKFVGPHINFKIVRFHNTLRVQNTLLFMPA